MTGWQTHASRMAYENPWIRIREDEVTRPDGGPGRYGVVEMQHPAVFVVALGEEDDVVLVDLFRYTIQRTSTEIPAGGTDGQDPLAAAQRELREETGLAADNWDQLGSMWALNGVAAAPEYVFLARGLHEVAGQAMAEEGISGVRRVPWPEVLRMIRAGEITDGESIASLMHAAIALGRVR